MQPRVVRVSSGADDFGALFEPALAAGIRVGWLDLTTALQPYPELASATSSGAMRAVSVNGGNVLSLKTMIGKPVLRDLIREHFTGCRLLLVHGDVEAPELIARSGEWVLQHSGREDQSFSTEELLVALRRPSFP